VLRERGQGHERLVPLLRLPLLLTEERVMKVRISDDKKGRYQSWEAEVVDDDWHGDLTGYGADAAEAITELKSHVQKRIAALQAFLVLLDAEGGE